MPAVEEPEPQDGATSAGGGSDAWQIVPSIVQAPDAVHAAIDVAALKEIMQEGQGHANYHTVQAMAHESKHDEKQKEKKTMINKKEKHDNARPGHASGLERNLPQ